jgi:hypothetical protein
MAEQVVLICDLCVAVKHAVARLALSNGHVTKRNAQQLDVCAKHQRAVYKMFKPRKRHGATPPPRPTGEAGEGKRTNRKSGMRVKFDVLAAKHWIKNQHGRSFNAMDIARHFKVKGAIVRKYLIAPMLEHGQLKNIGVGKIRSRKLVEVTAR